MDSFYKPLLVSLLLISIIEAYHHPGITVDLIHRDSALSPFDRLKKSIDRSFSRKNLLGLKSQVASPDSFDSNVVSDGGEYLMKIHLGTPPVEILAIADTGSDLTWTQCAPCNSCFDQRAPLFDPSRTRSYRRISCRSSQCTAAGGSCDNANSCVYEVHYGDRSQSLGEVAAETLTFKTLDSSRAAAAFPGFLFGCGHENVGTFNANTSGIIGLGGGKMSIVRQLSKSIGGRFSYCLTTLDSPSPSKISFGNDAVVTGHDVVSTPITKKEPDTFYYLTLEGISVGRRRVARNPPTTVVEAGEGNIIIDSGTTLTFLPQDMYDGLESALVSAIRAERTTYGSFGLCYSATAAAKGFSAPPIVVHFRGADLVLPPSSTFLMVEDGVICLTFVPSMDISIFGNLHQMNFHIGYDLEKGVVNFQPTDCSKHT